MRPALQQTAAARRAIADLQRRRTRRHSPWLFCCCRACKTHTCNIAEAFIAPLRLTKTATAPPNNSVALRTPRRVSAAQHLSPRSGSTWQLAGVARSTGITPVAHSRLRRHVRHQRGRFQHPVVCRHSWSWSLARPKLECAETRPLRWPSPRTQR